MAILRLAGTKDRVGQAIVRVEEDGEVCVGQGGEDGEEGWVV